MSMNGQINPDNRLINILNKVRGGGKLPVDEQEYLDHWVKRSAYGKQLLDNIENDDWLKENLKQFHEWKQGSNVRWELLQDKMHAIDGTDKKDKKVRFLNKWWVAAAAAALLCGIFIWQTLVNRDTPAVARAGTDDIQPGREGAVLTLSDGSSILLDTVKNSVIALQGGATARVINGAIVYDNNGHEAVMNTIATPNSRQYQLTLPDGTEVWLNNASSVTYPTVFKGKERKIEVTGEVYFEVAKNAKMPFKVNINNREEVVVLGTHFNVKGYKDEDNTKVTLLEGSVKVSSKEGSEVRIKPGEQAQIFYKATNKIAVQPVNAGESIAWKKGYFNFEGLNFKEVMRLLERWYDVEVVYKGEVPQINFGGDLNRNTTLKGAIKALEYYNVHLELQGKKIIVR
ncbi:MAG: FecR domain-containing protein [Niabella sp.]